MDGEIQLVSDDDGLVVAGDRSVVERFLNHAGLLPSAQEFSLGKLSSALRSASEFAKTASGVAEQSALYLKLTPESAQRLEDAGGLMPTKTKGISHIMLGDPGSIGGWLQAEDGPASLLTNPAVLAGVGGLMSQLAQQSEAQELKALLVRIDQKLDEVRRTQRDAILAKMHRAAAAIEEATTLHEAGGDPKTLWDKVSGESGTIHEVQNAALLELAALADRVEGKSKTGELKKTMRDVEGQVAIQLSILARCFELQDKFWVVELDHVLATAAENIEGHRVGVAEARTQRRHSVLERTERLMRQMDAAGGIANSNVLLHARAARAVIDSLNSTAAMVDDFHTPLGILAKRESLNAMRWGEAIRDRQQLKTAGVEAGQKVVIVGGGAAALAVAAVTVKNTPTEDA
jgi:hypothetical protein